MSFLYKAQLDTKNYPRKVIQPSTASNTRNHVPSIVRLTNGQLLCVFVYYGETSPDYSVSEIWAKTSSDNGKSWGTAYRVIAAPANTIGPEMVSLFKKANGNIILTCVIRVDTAPYWGRIWQYESTNSGVTFGSPKIIFESSDYETHDWISTGGHRLLQTTTGRLLLPFNRYKTDDHTSGTGIAVAGVLYSDDEGENWSVSATVIEVTLGGSDEVFLAESVILQLPNTNLLLASRTRSRFVRISTSTDDGATWSNPPDKSATLLAANASPFIKYINGKCIAVLSRPLQAVPSITGSATRVYLDIWKSEDSGATWSFVRNLCHSNSVNVYSEPIIFDLGDRALILYAEYPFDTATGVFQSLVSKELNYGAL